MNVEDSYEGALRRLSRLQRAGVVLAPPPAVEAEPDDHERMRDLEELAALACDENERLKQELAGARGELERLRQLVAAMQSSVSAEPDEPLSVPRTRGGAFYFFVFSLLAVAGVAVYALRPWERHAAPAASSEAAALPSAPAVQPLAPLVAKTEPAKTEPIKTETTIPKTEPIKAETTIPKAATTIPKVAPARHPAKRHAAKPAHHKSHKHASATKSKMEPHADDPLGGLNM